MSGLLHWRELARHVPLLPEEDYPRGNVKMDFKGSRSSISTDAADRMKTGQREQRAGLLYDETWPGFEPWTWPVVIGEGECAVLHLQDEDGGTNPTVLATFHHADNRLSAAAETIIDLHARVRQRDTCAILVPRVRVAR